MTAGAYYNHAKRFIPISEEEVQNAPPIKRAFT
jgi:hypothetical protein